MMEISKILKMHSKQLRFSKIYNISEGMDEYQKRCRKRRKDG